MTQNFNKHFMNLIHLWLRIHCILTQEIFDPFEINDDSDHIVEYHGELDPDKNYFNQFSYHLSQSSN